MVDTPPPAPPPAPPPGDPWFKGKADDAIIGHWKNKGWDANDPATIAINATRSHLEAEKYIGAPADQIVRLPKDPSDAAGWKEVHRRLGAPADAKEYDFTAVKKADGLPLDDRTTEALRETASKLGLSKTAAVDLAQSIAKIDDAKAANAKAEADTRLTANKAELAKNWGTNMQTNMFVAQQGAKALGITPEEVASMEGVVGYPRIMEMMRKIGATSKEANFIQDPAGSQNVMTREQAVAKKQSLMNDENFRTKWLAGDAQSVQELLALDMLLAGVQPPGR